MARVECTTNDVSFFKTHRTVEQRDGSKVFKLAHLRKNIYSLRDLRKLMSAANQRSFRGFNLFLEDDYRLFLTLARGEWCISGFRACDLRQHMPGLTSSRSSYLIKRMRTHGLIKKVGRRYKYYLTKLGRRVLATTLCIREFVVLPELSATA